MSAEYKRIFLSRSSENDPLLAKAIKMVLERNTHRICSLPKGFDLIRRPGPGLGEFLLVKDEGEANITVIGRRGPIWGFWPVVNFEKRKLSTEEKRRESD